MHLTAQMVVVYAVCASYNVTFKVLKTMTSQVYMRLVVFYIYFLKSTMCVFILFPCATFVKYIKNIAVSHAYR